MAADHGMAAHNEMGRTTKWAARRNGPRDEMAAHNEIPDDEEQGPWQCPALQYDAEEVR